MPVLPIPIVSSLVLGFLLVRMVLVDRRHTPLALLLALAAVQGVVIALANHYHVGWARGVQPVLATMIPPLAWVSFQTTAIRDARAVDAVHVAGPVLAAVAFVAAPMVLDALIPGLFAVYGAGIVWVSLRGPDALPRLRLSAGNLPALIWTIIGASLIGSAISDVLIVAAIVTGNAQWHPWIISIYSSAMLLIIGMLSLSNALDTAGGSEDAVEADPPEVSEQDTHIVARLDALMAAERLYLDPDLTLTRLARRLVLPVKQVSAAINRVTGENVSRYINAARIKAAQQALADGESVTEAMLASGFATKSNFNREFLRVTGQSPTDWIKRGSDEP